MGRRPEFNVAEQYHQQRARIAHRYWRSVACAARGLPVPYDLRFVFSMGYGSEEQFQADVGAARKQLVATPLHPLPPFVNDHQS